MDRQQKAFIGHVTKRVRIPLSPPDKQKSPSASWGFFVCAVKRRTRTLAVRPEPAPLAQERRSAATTTRGWSSRGRGAQRRVIPLYQTAKKLGASCVFLVQLRKVSKKCRKGSASTLPAGDPVQGVRTTRSVPEFSAVPIRLPQQIAIWLGLLPFVGWVNDAANDLWLKKLRLRRGYARPARAGQARAYHFL